MLLYFSFFSLEFSSNIPNSSSDTKDILDLIPITFLLDL